MCVPAETAPPIAIAAVTNTDVAPLDPADTNVAGEWQMRLVPLAQAAVPQAVKPRIYAEGVGSARENHSPLSVAVTGGPVHESGTLPMLSTSEPVVLTTGASKVCVPWLAHKTSKRDTRRKKHEITRTQPHAHVHEQPTVE